MCWWGDVTRLIKAGMAPPDTTAAVCSDVPEAMLVRAQDASNWIGGQSTYPRKETNLGMRPALISWSMGGCLSRDSNFLYSKTVHKSYCASSYVAFIYGKRRKKKKDDFFNAQSLPCSLCSLELGLRIPTVHSCDNLLDRPLPEPLHRTTESSLLDMQI